MKTLVLKVMLFLNLVRVTGRCEEGHAYIFSANQVESQRCTDDKLFYYTSRYANQSFCTASNTINEGYCWWDTTAESHCLHSEECLWLDDNVAGGACYCAKTDTCDNCNGHTPSPSYESFDCPEGCKVFYVGCPSMYCNCFGECASASDLGCSDPVDPHCHTWYTDNPTVVAPTFPKLVHWGCKLCCFAEYKIWSTTSSIASALWLDDNQVKIKRYEMVEQGNRRRSEVDQQWEIEYEIGLEEEDSAEEMINNLEDPIVLNTIQQYIGRDVDIVLEPIETTYLSVTFATTTSPSNSMGGIIGGIIAALVAVVVFGFLGYRLYIRRKFSQKVDTASMTATGLCPVKDDEVTNL